MNEGRAPLYRCLRLFFLLVLTQLCLASALRAQGTQEPDAGAPAPSQPTGNPPPAPYAAEPNPSYDSMPPVPPPAGPDEVLPSGLPAPPPLSIPYSAVEPIQGVDRNNFDPFSYQSIGTSVNQNLGAKVGHAQGSLSLGNVGVGGSYVPFIRRSPAPTDADVKLGPIYLYLYRLQSDFLYTDNVNLTTHNRRSTEYAIITLNMELIAQLTDDLQFAVYGSLIYLPLQNIFAATEASALQGGLGFLLGALPVLTGQVSYSTQVGGWDVILADKFQSATGYYSDSTRDQYNLFQGSVIQTGGNPNSFRSSQVGLRNSNGAATDDTQDYFSYYSNTVSAAASGQLAQDVSGEAIATRTDLLYGSGSRNLPSSRDDLYMQAVSTRPTWRFEPFASYDIRHTSSIPGVFQVFRAGFSGPITDQLYITASAGYFFDTQGQADSLYQLTLRHVAGPYTTEELEIARALSYYDDEVFTTEYYLLSQVLGPTLNASAFGDHSEFQELLNDGVSNRSQEDAGAELTWAAGPSTSLQLSGIYSHQDFDDGTTTDTWTGRFTLSRVLSDTLFFQAFYQFQHYDTNAQDRKYEENLVYLSLVKYFH